MQHFRSQAAGLDLQTVERLSKGWPILSKGILDLELEPTWRLVDGIELGLSLLASIK